MAVKEVAQHPIDLASADANGGPLVATDATHVDDTTTPGDVASTGSAGTSVLAAPADHAHKGVRSLKSDANAQLFGDVELISGTGVSLTQLGQQITVSGNGASVNKVTWAEDTQKSNVGNVEEILFEWNINVDDCGFPNIQARLTALVRTTGGTATFNLRFGATAPGAITGSTIRATVSTVSATYEQQTNLGAAFANPGGDIIVQLTAVNSALGNRNLTRGIQCSVG